MRGLRTVPHLWRICEDMGQVCPHAILMQYVNPMAIITWAIGAKYPAIRQAGLCHSIQITADDLAHDLDVPVEDLRYKVAGINHMAFFLSFEQKLASGAYRDLYPALRAGYRDGRIPKPNRHSPRCPNKVRYEMMMRLGYFVTESSEHFAEYVPWFIKDGRPDLIDRFEIPLDEYPKRCIEQMAAWQEQNALFRGCDRHRVERVRVGDRQFGGNRRTVGDLRQSAQ
jgi:alpha-galactosidase